MKNCTINCLDGKLQPRLPLDDAVLTPYVEVVFGSDFDNYITVGNNPSPDYGNNASITSFSYGSSNGHALDIEISDQEGSTFEVFMNSAARRLTQSAVEGNRLLFRFGWIGRNCDNTSTPMAEPYVSPWLVSTVVSIDPSYDHGRIKFKVGAVDLGQLIFVMGENRVIGADTAPQSLEDALRQLFTSPPDPTLPSPTYDEFLMVTPSLDSNNKIVLNSNWKFKGNPRATWHTEGQNKINAANKWKYGFVSENGHGSFFMSDNTTGKNIMYLVEHIPGFKAYPFDVYYVNAGNCSNVISFSPSFKSLPGLVMLSHGGGTAGGTSGKTVNSGQVDASFPAAGNVDQPKDVGSLVQSFVTNPVVQVYGKKAIERAIVAHGLHDKAAMRFDPKAFSVDAEMDIQGDIRFVHPQIVGVAQVTVVVMNPFYLSPSSNSCGDWLAKPNCNPVLTNTNWLIKGVTHSISQGSFVTKLSLTLAISTVDILSDVPMGGPGAGTYLPTNAK